MVELPRRPDEDDASEDDQYVLEYERDIDANNQRLHAIEDEHIPLAVNWVEHC